jgi:hypothetical protein
VDSVLLVVAGVLISVRKNAACMAAGSNDEFGCQTTRERTAMSNNNKKKRASYNTHHYYDVVAYLLATTTSRLWPVHQSSVGGSSTDEDELSRR